MKEINILDKEYAQWVKSLVAKYRQSQVKAAVKVNTEVLRFYWELGKDIVERDAENQYGSRFYASLSRDLKKALSDRWLLGAKPALYEELLSALQRANWKFATTCGKF